MAYKIPDLPSAKAYKEEIADFWEVQALRNQGTYISQTQIAQSISKELDELDHDGIESEDDKLDNELEDVFIELQRRPKFTSNKYPFSFTKYSMRLNNPNDILARVYIFLLLCTRFNMKTNKIQNGIDGTLLFEKLCAHVAKNYFGSNSDSFIFGTADPGSFEDKVKDLIANIGEGGSFKNPDKNFPTKNDDGVDIVVWKEFSDQRIGKLIGFGQCKTGTDSWRDGKSKLNPEHFCSKWLYQEPVYRPLRLLFICDTLNEDFNFFGDQQGFLVFNRFRVLEYVNDTLADKIKQDLTTWIDGAMEFIEYY